LRLLPFLYVQYIVANLTLAWHTVKDEQLSCIALPKNYLRYIKMGSSAKFPSCLYEIPKGVRRATMMATKDDRCPAE